MIHFEEVAAELKLGVCGVYPFVPLIQAVKALMSLHFVFSFSDSAWRRQPSKQRPDKLLPANLGCLSTRNLLPKHSATMRAVAWRTCRLPRHRYRTFASGADASPVKVKYHPAPHSGNIRILLLDRPEARNALSRRLVDDLKRHVDEVQAEGGTGSTRALIIASNTDKAFCAGADLRERKGMTQEE